MKRPSRNVVLAIAFAVLAAVVVAVTSFSKSGGTGMSNSPIRATNLRFRNPDGSQPIFNMVVAAEIGFTKGSGHSSWMGWPDRHGVCSLDELSEGQHLLMAAPAFGQRTAFRAQWPGGDETRTLTLREFPKWPDHQSNGKVSVDAWSHKVSVEKAENGDEIVVFRFHNHSETKIQLQPQDVRFIVFNYDKMVSSPRLIAGNDDAAIVMGDDETEWRVEPGGQTTIRVNWPNCVRNGLWSWGDTNGPAILTSEDSKQVGVRPCIRNHGAVPITLTDPDVIVQQTDAQ